MTDYVEVNVRGVTLKMLATTRALKLCARFNREIEVLDLVDELEQGVVFFDLGACEGRFSVYAAKKGLRVVAVEPETKNYDALIENMRLNGMEGSDSVTCLKCAVGAADDSGELLIGQDWAGGHWKRLAGVDREDMGFPVVTSERVSVRSLDSIVEELGIFPSCLKIDVDGAESMLLEGGRKTLGNPALEVVMIELLDREASVQCGDVWESLIDHRFFEVDRFKVDENLWNIRFERA